MKQILFLALIGLVIVSTGLCGCLGYFEGYDKKAQEFTSADYAIDHYKFFIDKYNTIRQIGAQLRNVDVRIKKFEDMHPNPSTWTRTENNNYADIEFVKSGYEAQYNLFVGEYNSRMRDLTTNQVWMKPQNFPQELSLYSPDNIITMENPELSYK